MKYSEKYVDTTAATPGPQLKSTPDTLTWDIKKRDGSKEEILINKKESNKY